VRPQTRIRRFSPLQRLFHLFLMLTFLTQASTGLARMFIETRWGKNLAGFFRRLRDLPHHPRVRRYLHALRLCAPCGLCPLENKLAGVSPEPVRPRLVDAPVQGSQRIPPPCRLVLERHPRPEFDRWGYWEKFDYWAVFWGFPFSDHRSASGLSLSASQIMPGWMLNIAFWIHRIEAILAMCHVFIIHFFIGHLRPHSFPMDQAMFAGSVDVDDARHERPIWIARLERAGTLQSALVSKPSAAGRAVFYVFGYLAMATGVFLLIGGLVNAPFITW